MQIIKLPSELTTRALKARRAGKRVGFVPTMGYLHTGHLSLVRRAASENDVVIVSIFVNPKQFGPNEDFGRYPRNLKRDLWLLAREKVDYVFVPSVSAIYPRSFRAFVNPGPLARGLCGPARPGHFRGVATVVKRLFEIARPHSAYFGQKDYQQARIIQEMSKRLALKVRVVICPIIREKDGLAMSSRNVYLTPAERKRARTISESLRFGHRLILAGIDDAEIIREAILRYLKLGADRVDYVDIVDVKRLKPLRKIRGKGVMAVACRVGRTRLIDNLLIQV